MVGGLRPPAPAILRTRILRYYARYGRDLPWRRTRDPYAVLVSEVMLQQTQVSRVVPAYRAFLARFPTLRALARASLGDVLRAWSGLGYNRRARDLHRSARLHPESLPRRVAELVLAELGLSKSQVSELQKIPLDRLSGAAAEAMKKMPRPKSSLRRLYGEYDWGPTVDGLILPRHPFDPGAPQISADVPLLTGTDLHEGVSGLDRPDANAMGVEELNRLVKEEIGEGSQTIIDAYRRDYPKATPFDLYAIIAAAPFRRAAFEQAIRKAALGSAPAYSYIYSWRTPVLDNRPGSFHACEIAFTFDNAEICDHYSGGTPEAFVLSKQISTAWMNFARTGNPNHDGLPHWPAYTSEQRATMYFDTPCAVRNNPEGEGLRLIAQS